MSNSSTLKILENYKPSDFGLDPAIYPEYRKHPVTGQEVQLEVIEFAAYCERRFACASAPVGIGKSLISITLARLTGMRTAIVVPLKGLQKQYVDDFAGQLVNIQGRGNYSCGDYANLDCKSGLSMGCRYAGGKGCAYEKAVGDAREAPVLVTNYDYWLAKNAHGGGLERTEEAAEELGENPIELLILDEGDLAAEKVSEYLSCRVYENEIKRWVDPKKLGDRIETWKAFVKSHAGELDKEIQDAGIELAALGRRATKQQVEVLHGLQRLKDKFDRISSIQDDWVLEERIGTKWGRMWCFDVIWPGRYTESVLFRGIPKVVIMAGTLVVKDLSLIGVKKGEYEYKQWGSIFPVSRQPTYILPPRKQVGGSVGDGGGKGEGKGWVNINIDQKTKSEDLRIWIDLIDWIIENRFDRKILIGTTSYDWQRRIMDMSRYRDLMIGNTDDPESDSAQDAAEKFFEMPAPKVLISPSFSRGWNFAFARAEVAILSKCPFVPMQGKVMRARLEKDKGYGDLLCMKKIEQFNGRIKRAPDDRGEVFLVDGHFTYFLKRAERLAQDWFVQSVRRVVELPKCPPKL